MYIMIFETRRCPVASSKETGRQVNLIFMFIVNSFDILSMSLNLDEIRPALDSDPPTRMLRHFGLSELVFTFILKCGSFATTLSTPQSP